MTHPLHTHGLADLHRNQGGIGQALALGALVAVKQSDLSRFFKIERPTVHQFVRQLNRDGPSEFNFSNGDKLIGTFKGGFVLSPARVEYADGKVFYGSFLKNAIHGTGTMTYPNGDRYDGTFVKGRRHGRGTYRFATGGRYVGDFNNDMLTGVGSFVYANGDTYTGQVLNGMHHGRGKQTFAGGRVPLEGVWDHGAFVQMERLN